MESNATLSTQKQNWIPVTYNQDYDGYILSKNQEKPKDRHFVLVLVEGNYIPYVSYLKTWSNGSFWIIPGGTADSKPFKVTHYCDCLPRYDSYKNLIIPFPKP